MAVTSRSAEGRTRGSAFLITSSVLWVSEGRPNKQNNRWLLPSLVCVFMGSFTDSFISSFTDSFIGRVEKKKRSFGEQQTQIGASEAVGVRGDERHDRRRERVRQ